MGLYTYKLNKIEENESKTYKEKDLLLMTTFQLREICTKEKLVKSIVDPLDKEELIKLIMKYRGEKDNRLINNYTEGGLNNIENFIKESSKREVESNIIDYCGKITVYENLSIEIYDDYEIKTNEDISEGNVILADSEFNVCTILNIKKIKKNNKYKYFFVKGKDVDAREGKSKFYNLMFFKEKESELLYDVYEGKNVNSDLKLEYSQVPVLRFELKELEETSMPLAIDFGTSNTTAGIYIDKEIFNGLNESLIKEKKYELYEDEKVKLVKLLDTTKENYTLSPLIPSIVGVKYINENNDEIEYIFGYDAMAASKKRYVDDSLTVFYDIKRWISDFEKDEKVIDIHGKTTLIKRKQIIKAYLEYVISLANQRFKCKFKNIYISCPTKQKYKFHKLFEEVLSNYNVQSENMLEESVGVLYNTISDLIDRNKYVQGEKYKALIIDCGGGTTDLSGAAFSIRNNRVSYKINIETSYENGDTDFGGNNLTFRILQFLKILMAQALIKEDYEEVKKALIDEFKIDIFRSIDKYGIKELYETLDENYEKAENIIPTKFKLYETRNKEDYCKVRNNYYFLFNLAEEVKKIFFGRPELIKIYLAPEIIKDNKLQDNEDSTFIIFDKWKLSYRQDDVLKVVKEAPRLTITTYEINTLIKGDVYGIIKKFLESLYEKDELYDYSLIKLTGQSCQVDIFKDALKEFIPGRIIEINKSKKDSYEDYDLKLSCLKGTLKYLHSKNFGYADIQIENNTCALPYVITAFTHSGEEITLIKNNEINRGFVSRFMDRILIKLYLKDNNNNVKYEYDYKFNNEELEITNAKAITERYPHIKQPETDNIENNEIKFFVWAEKELWGFCVVAILRQNHELYMGKEEFFYFENDKWEKNFFDGNN